MTKAVVVTVPADVQMIDETGYVWTFLHEAAETDRVAPGALIVAGDPVEPFLARVVDIVDGHVALRSCTSTSSVSPRMRSTSFVTRACCPRRPVTTVDIPCE